MATLREAAQAALGRAQQDVHLPVGQEDSPQVVTDEAQEQQLGETEKEKAQSGAQSPKAPQFSYADTTWSKWPMCSSGIKQSPIDLQRPYFGSFFKLKMNYKDQLNPVQENDGLVLKIPFKVGDGSHLGIGDKKFTPVEAIFRAPSEHKLDGRSFDMEMQIMHTDAVGNQIGLSVLMMVSKNVPKDNFYIKNVFSHFFEDLPEYGGKRYVESMNLKWILNEQMMEHYVTYHGSLTHPPCTEGVEWFILGRPWLVEKKWVDNFKKVLKPNSRPVQPTGERVIHSF